MLRIQKAQHTASRTINTDNAGAERDAREWAKEMPLGRKERNETQQEKRREMCANRVDAIAGEKFNLKLHVNIIKNLYSSERKRFRRTYYNFPFLFASTIRRTVKNKKGLHYVGEDCSMHCEKLKVKGE